VAPTPAPGSAPAGTTQGPSSDHGGAADADSGAASTIPVERYNYQLNVTGTYPALMDLLNQLVTRKKLLKINKVTISKSALDTAEPPDAKVYPDYPVKLDMAVSLSIFLYEDNNAHTAAP
jgi:hypothetical protein